MQTTSSVNELIRRKIIQPLLGFLRQGVTPSKLSLTVALGVIIGMLPVFGVAALLCALVAVSLRLNMAAIQLTHYVATPLQVLLFIPFVKLGGVVLNRAPMPFSFSQLYHMFTTDAVATFQKLWFTFFMGFTGWLLVSIPVAFLLYFSTLPVFKKINADQLNPASQA
ncbi:MAG: DUF2062 domain-containing protein [Ferruginibacter sp.]|nr:DUF2062 domain-containing protein [Cytophagales bacterium]